MNTQNDSRDDSAYERSDYDHALDQLLESARWPETKREQLSRLAARWRKLRQRRRFIPWQAAAAILAAAGLVWWAVGRNADVGPEEDRSQATAERDSQAPSEVEDNRPNVPKPTDAPDDYRPADIETANASVNTQPTRNANGIVPRDPSPLEMLVYVSARRGHVRDDRRGPTRSRKPLRVTPGRPADVDRLERLEKALAALDDDVEGAPLDAEDQRAVELAETLSPDAPWYEARLNERLEDRDDPLRAAAIRLWTQLAGPRAVPRLRELYGEEATRDVALAGLLRWEGSRGLAWLIESTDDEDVRYVVLAELFRRGDERSVGLFLKFVLRDETAALACESLDEVEVPPIETLFAFLQATRRPLRLAAAFVLGRIGDSIVVERLTAMVHTNDSPQDALAALVSSSHPDAAEFVSRASGELYLAATVRAAGYQLKSLPVDLWRLPR